jgi:hypothetical protein
MVIHIFIGNSILVQEVTAYKEIIVSSDDTAEEDTSAGDSEGNALAPSNATEVEHLQPIDSKSVGSQSLANSTGVGVQLINNTQATTTIEIGTTTQALSVETINVDNPRHDGNTSEAHPPTTTDEAVNAEDSESDIEIEEMMAMLGACDCTWREGNTPFCMHEETGLISHRSKCTMQTNPSDCQNVTGATHTPAVCTWIPIPINNDEDKNIGDSASNASFQVICIGSGGSLYENDVSTYLLTSYTGADRSQEHYLLMDGGSFVSGIQHSIDAGVLPPNASQAVEAVAIGHTHLDHILGYAMGTPEMKSHTLIGLPNTVEVLQHHIFNGGICNLSCKIPISCMTICILKLKSYAHPLDVRHLDQPPHHFVGEIRVGLDNINFAPTEPYQVMIVNGKIWSHRTNT